MGLLRRLTLFLILSCLAWAESAPPAEIVPLRARISNCEVLINYAHPDLNDSVGLKFSASDIDSFRAKLVEMRAAGEELPTPSTLYVMGVAMGREKETQAQYRDLLQELGMNREGITIKAFSVPRTPVSKSLNQSLRAFYERLRYFFPSVTRDYQTPTASEISSGLITGSLLAIPTILFVTQTQNTLDASLVLSVHLTLGAFFSVYKKFMTNWALRPGSGEIAAFLKQIGQAVPFVANFNIFGNFSKILAYFNEHGWEATARQFPAEAMNFGATQGLTLVLQTLFFNTVIIQGVRAWENKQTNPEDVEDARFLSNWVSLPILAVNALILPMASGSSAPLLTYGPMSLNEGHLWLVATAIVGSALKFWPQLLNPVIPAYRSIRQKMRSNKSSDG